MMVYLVLLLSCCNRLESTSTGGAFKDFLNYNALQQAIIICDSNDFKPQLLSDFKYLITHYRVQFHHLPNATWQNNTSTLYHSANLQHVIDRSDTKLAIYMKIIYSELLKDDSQSLHQNYIKNDLLKNSKFKNSHIWFIVLNITARNVTVFDCIKDIFWNVNLNLASDVTVVVQPNDDSPIILYDVYKVCHKCGTPVEIEFKGNWSASQGLYIDAKFKDGFMVRRRNFRNITINTTTVLGEVPQRFTALEFLDNDIDEKALNNLQRRSFQLIKSLQSLYQFRFNIVFSTEWGVLLPNGSWTGMVDLVSTHKVDFSICPLRATIPRMQVVDNSLEMHTVRQIFLLRHPKYSNLRNIFLEPLSNNVWWCILAVIFIAILILFCQIQWEFQQSELYENSTRATKYNFAVLMILETVLMQGPMPSTFQLISTRTLIMTLCLFTALILQFYEAYIVGSLVTEPNRWITTLEALYKSDIIVGMEDIAYNYDVIMNSNDSLLRRMYIERICKNGKPYALPLHLAAARIADGGYAFATSEKIYFLLKDILSELEYCQLQEVDYRSIEIGSFIFPKASPYRQHMQYNLLKLQTGGLIRYSDIKWQPNPVDCNIIRNHQIIKVDLEHFLSSIIFLTGMMLASLLVLSIEIIYKLLKRRHLPM